MPSLARCRWQVVAPWSQVIEWPTSRGSGTGSVSGGIDDGSPTPAVGDGRADPDGAALSRLVEEGTGDAGPGEALHAATSIATTAIDSERDGRMAMVPRVTGLDDRSTPMLPVCFAGVVTPTPLVPDPTGRATPSGARSTGCNAVLLVASSP